MFPSRRILESGPFLADQVHSGDPFEISRGMPLYCAPTGGSGSGPNALGASVLGWDPAVKEAGVDAGYSPEPDMLRAPDVAIGNVPDKPGWIHGVPELAVEYADIGQDEPRLQSKIADLLGAGTRVLWVVRLTGPRRVEIHRPGEPFSLAYPGDMLTAPGILQNPVLVEALYDRSAAERATLTNLLQRQGYADLEAVLQKGFEEGRDEGLKEGRDEGLKEGRDEGLKEGRDEGKLGYAREALHAMLTRRRIPRSADTIARIDTCTDLPRITRWLERAADAAPEADPSTIFGAD